MKASLLKTLTMFVAAAALIVGVHKLLKQHKLPDTHEVQAKIEAEQPIKELTTDLANHAESNEGLSKESEITKEDSNKNKKEVKNSATKKEQNKNPLKQNNKVARHRAFGKKPGKKVKVNPLSDEEADFVWEKMIPHKKYKDDLSGQYEPPTEFSEGKVVKYESTEAEIISELEEAIQ